MTVVTLKSLSHRFFTDTPNMAQAKIEELGAAIEALGEKIKAAEGGQEACDALEAEFAFVKEDSFEADIMASFVAAGDGDGSPLTFEQFFPLIKAAAKEFGEKISKENALEVFNDFDADSSGTCDVEEFANVAIAFVMVAGFAALVAVAEEMGIEV